MGLSYSRAWERISKIERLLGVRLLLTKRGGARGGGAQLTEEGRELLEYYLSMYRKIQGRPFSPVTRTESYTPAEVVISGSHDFIVTKVVGLLRENGWRVELHWTGSTNGLAALILGEADIIGVHLLDPVLDSYNKPIFDRLGLSGKALLIRGYDRAQGFFTRTPMSLDEIIEGLMSGKLVLANRLHGSGTRILMDILISEWARKQGINPEKIKNNIKGYESQYRTHLDVAEAVSKGEADVGIGLMYAAHIYKLHFTLVRWEHYDFLVNTGFYYSRQGSELMSKIIEELYRIGKEMIGYKVSKELGTVIAR